MVVTGAREADKEFSWLTNEVEPLGVPKRLSKKDYFRQDLNGKPISG